MSETERSVALWLLNHRSGLLADIALIYRNYDSLFPPKVYSDIYADNILTFIKSELAVSHLNLNSEHIALLITRPWLTLLLGHKFFTPPERTK